MTQHKEAVMLTRKIAPSLMAATAFAPKATLRPGKSWARRLGGAICAMLMAGWATGSSACGFHTYLPQKTAVDWIIESDHLALARNSQESAFRYQVVETLRGTDQTAEISYLVNSTTRRSLEANPEDSVLLAFDTESQSWKYLAYLTPEYRNVVDEVLRSAPNWGAGYDPDRFRIFAALQDHPDAALRGLALREIDQAPYALLRTMNLRIPAKDLLAELLSPTEIPYQPIRILLLGLSDDDLARSALRGFVDRAAKRDWGTNLGAYATALVEIDQVAGVERLERMFFSDASQPLDKLEQVVEALAIHNDIGTPELKSAIGAAIAQLVWQRPDTAALVARQFGNRQDWSQAHVLEPVMKDRNFTNTEDFLRVAIYVAQGRQAGNKNTPASGD